MRQGQQNRRGRGRNNNNRKGHNPLARSFESNGPDVKIRGTPAHIAEKYLTLARDAQSSGDPVLAENYLQHAEHYTRIIMAYREQLQQPGDMSQRQRPAHACGGRRRRRVRRRRWRGGGSTTAFQPPMPQQMQPQAPAAPARRATTANRNDGNRHDRPYRRDHVRPLPRATATGDRDRDRGDRDRQARRPPDAQSASRSASRNAHRSRRKPGAVESRVAATGSPAARTSSPNSCAVRCAAPAARTASQPRPPRKSRAIDAASTGFVIRRAACRKPQIAGRTDCRCARLAGMTAARAYAGR